MTKIKTRNTITTIIMILMMAFGVFAAVINIPAGSAQVHVENVDLQGPWFLPYLGINSPTVVVWEPNPNVFREENYPRDVPAWPDAVITFTRPDGTIQETRNGPFKLQFPPPQTPGDIQIEEPWTPDAQGIWTVNVYWPGDSKYAAINDTATKYVGVHYDKRDVWCFLSLKPYPNIGVGQILLINAWVSPPPGHAHMVFEDILFTVTNPTGSSYTVGPMDTEAPGTVWFELTFDQKN